MAEKDLTIDDIREEHLREIHQPAQWAYLFGVLIGGTLLMLLYIAILGGSSG
jgi:hypothetical protein